MVGGGRLCWLSVVWKLTFVFVYFEVGISSTYIPISTNNILQEILVWVLKWNRFGFFYCFEATQNSIYLLTKKTIWNTTQIFFTSFLFYNLHSMYIWFSFFINQFWLYNKTRKKERAKMLCNISSWNSPTPNFLAE